MKFDLNHTFATENGAPIFFSEDKNDFRTAILRSLDANPLDERNTPRPATYAEMKKRMDIEDKIIAAQNGVVELDSADVEELKKLILWSFAPMGARPLLRYLDSPIAVMSDQQ